MKYKIPKPCCMGWVNSHITTGQKYGKTNSISAQPYSRDLEFNNENSCNPPNVSPNSPNDIIHSLTHLHREWVKWNY